MFTSIPYDSGWTAYVDGKEADIQTVAGAFIALDLKAGAHTIEFKYFPRGLHAGILITLVGWLVFAFLMNMKSIKEKKNGRKKLCREDTIVDDTATENEGDSDNEEACSESEDGDVKDSEDENANTEDSDEYVFEDDTTKLEAAMKLAEQLCRKEQK